MRCCAQPGAGRRGPSFGVERSPPWIVPCHMCGFACSMSTGLFTELAEDRLVGHVRRRAAQRREVLRRDLVLQLVPCSAVAVHGYMLSSFTVCCPSARATGRRASASRQQPARVQLLPVADVAARLQQRPPASRRRRRRRPSACRRARAARAPRSSRSTARTTRCRRRRCRSRRGSPRPRPRAGAISTSCLTWIVETTAWRAR